MKKLTAFIAALLVLGSFVMADVSVKDLGDGTAEVTFFYGNPKASEVVVAGTWTDWEKAAHPMTKVEKGWEYKTVQPHDAVLKYKFISDGNWTPDLKAPDNTDDGFGGKNGLVEVAKLVAVEKAKATGDTAALEKLSAAGLKFGMFTQVNLNTNFLTRGVVDKTKDGFETDSVQIRAKSYWKISGDILPNMPTYIELKAFDGTKNIYDVTNDGVVDPKVADGLDSFATGMLFHPFNYLNGNENSLLGHFKAGLNTPFVNLETGYNWAKPSKRENILWLTVKDGDANAGYLQISNGANIQQFGDVKIDAALVPNKSQGNLAMRNWVNVAYKDMVTAEVQWDVKSNAAEQVGSEFFSDFTGNVIPGVKFNMSGFDLKAQASIPVASDKVEDGMAFKVLAGYGMDMFGVTSTFGNYQKNAYLMYGDDDHVKNNAEKTIVELNPWVKPVDGLKIGLDNKMTTNDKFKMDVKNEFNFKPYVNVDLGKLAAVKMTVDGYSKLFFDANADEDAFKFNELGLKLGMTEVSEAVPSFDVYYGLQNADIKSLHTLIASMTTKPGIGIDIGTGIRLTNSDATEAQEKENCMLGFVMGADYKVKALKDGVLFGAFVYNMDPYDDDKDDLKWSDYRPDKDIDDFAGNAKFRLGMKWDF
jgi:hypothetical protein